MITRANKVLLDTLQRRGIAQLVRLHATGQTANTFFKTSMPGQPFFPKAWINSVATTGLNQNANPANNKQQALQRISNNRLILGG